MGVKTFLLVLSKKRNLHETTQTSHSCSSCFLNRVAHKHSRIHWQKTHVSAVWPVSLTKHRRERWQSPSVGAVCLSVSVSVFRFSSPPSFLCSCTSSSISCLCASPSADKSFIPWWRAALQAAAEAPVCVGILCYMVRPHDLVWTLQKMVGCFDFAASLIAPPSTFYKDCSPDNDHSSLCTPANRMLSSCVIN